MKRSIAWALLLALPVVLAIVAAADAQQAKSGGTLRVAWEQDVTGFDPHWTSGLQVTLYRREPLQQFGDDRSRPELHSRAG